jgi:hypothetical protein
MKKAMFLLLIFSSSVVFAKEKSSEVELASESCSEKAARYVYSWPISNDCDDSPRGGSSRGADVTISSAAHVGWSAIKRAGPSKFEQDRAAILAMQGGYKVDFNFLETTGFHKEFKRDKPYHSWGTEYVYVVENESDYISLQHLMVMYFKQDDGDVSEPFVMKHWRQDWTYQDTSILQYDHRNTWRKVTLDENDVKGKWTQAVFQVDDSPRYESIGKWEHNASFSTWISDTTRRPLPRREFSVRDDYQVLEGFNRHTITANGWLQEEENWKLVVDENGDADKTNPYLSKEMGLARYQPVSGFDFSAGDSYMKRTSEFWKLVRSSWADVIVQTDKLELHKSVDGEPLFMPMFDYANTISKEEPFNSGESTKFIKSTLAKYIKSVSK